MKKKLGKTGVKLGGAGTDSTNGGVIGRQRKRGTTGR